MDTSKQLPVMVPIFGGDGNVLFQLAGALEIAKRRGCEIRILDCRAKQAPMIYTTLRWTQHNSTFVDGVLESFVVVEPKLLDNLNFIFSYIKQIKLKIVCENDQLHLSYFQSRSEISMEVIQTISAKLSIYIKDSKPSKFSLIHFRGGDSPRSSRETQYKAILALAGDERFKNALIISDDPILMSELPFSSISGHLIEDFINLTNASKLFLGDSTFAFWAAVTGNAKHLYTYRGSLIDRLKPLLKNRITIVDAPE